MNDVAEGHSPDPGGASATGAAAFENEGQTSPKVAGNDSAELDARIAADRQIIELLDREKYFGPKFERFVTELARYALAVLSGMMRSRQIFYISANRGFILPRAELDEDDIVQLADETVATALRRFVEYQRMGRGWDESRGAAVSTYFIGLCLLDFSNVYRRWFRLRQRPGTVPIEELPEQAQVMDEGVLDRVMYDELLDSLSDGHARDILKLRVAGYRNNEIADLLGISVRSIEGKMYRIRRRLRNSDSN